MTRAALAFLFAVACSHQSEVEPQIDLSTLNAAAITGVNHPALAQLLHEHWELTMVASPVWATKLGDHRYDDQLGDYSAMAIASRERAIDGLLQRAKALDRSGMTPEDVTTSALFVESLEYDVKSRSCQFWKWSISPRSNVYVWMAGLPDSHVVKTAEDGAALLARYKGIEQMVKTNIENLRLGLSEGRVANGHSVQLIVEMLEKELAKPIEESPFYRPIQADRPGWEPQALATWRDAMTEVVSTQIQPAYSSYIAFLKTEVLPKARGGDQEGIKYVKDGEACYQSLILSYTTLPKTADELHETGLEALRGIHDEFRALGPKTVESDDLATIFERLRTKPSLYFETEEQVVLKAESSLAAATKIMGDWFGRLPKAACKVTPIPEHEAPYTTIAYYSQPHVDGSKPGEYFVNTYAPKTRPRHEAEVLAFHEAIPGHHLQIAIAQELPDLPAFRKYEGQTAFVEGWALYTERLSEEMGLYTADTDRLGMLSFDAWRASRLVVDTGLHHRGWTRQQAETFLAENTPLALNNIRNEVDRYITTPGQALAYKTGQIEMWRLRRDAEKRLGKRFDIKGFHDVVLGAGAVSLPVLRKRVEEWVTSMG